VSRLDLTPLIDKSYVAPDPQTNSQIQ